MTDESLSVIAHFDVRRRVYVAPDGTVAGKLPAFAADTSALIALYRAMVLTRTFDLKAVSLQRTGRLGTYAVSLGQEAVSVGVASAMRQEDVLLPSYRDNGMLLWRGVKMEEILLYWGGDERGNLSSGPAHDFPILRAGRLAGAARCRRCLCYQVPQGAAGCRMPAGRWRHLEGRCLRGDELRRRAEAAARVRRQQQPVGHLGAAQGCRLHAQTLAQKAIAAGFAGEQVDGNDVIAVRAAAEEAIVAARAGQGPRLIEALTYRLGDHTTADDAARYRPPEEVQAHWKEEPIARLRAFSSAGRRGARPRRSSSPPNARAQVEAAVERYLATPAARAGEHVRSPLRRAAPCLCRASETS